MELSVYNEPPHFKGRSHSDLAWPGLGPWAQVEMRPRNMPTTPLNPLPLGPGIGIPAEGGYDARFIHPHSHTTLPKLRRAGHLLSLRSF